MSAERPPGTAVHYEPGFCFDGPGCITGCSAYVKCPDPFVKLPTPWDGWATRIVHGHPLRGQCFPEDKLIVLREWDSEVFLHECLHALCRIEGIHFTGRYSTEEEAVAWLSQHLDRIGFRVEGAT